MDIRLIALDLDGTLLNRDQRFPEINRRALRECRRRGIRLLLNSGRAFEVLCGFVEDLGVDAGIVSVNGARVDEGVCGPTLIERVFDPSHAARTDEILRRSGASYTVYTRGHTYMGNSAARFHLPRFRGHVAEFFECAGHGYETVDDEQRLLLEGLYKPYKFVVMGEMHDPRFPDILEKLREMNLSVYSSRADNLEIMMPGVDKGFALQYVMKRLDIPPESVMAFGDSNNDLPMLRVAGWPVVMENADTRMREAARILAPDNDHGGVGQTLIQYVLGE